MAVSLPYGTRLRRINRSSDVLLSRLRNVGQSAVIGSLWMRGMIYASCDFLAVLACAFVMSSSSTCRVGLAASGGATDCFGLFSSQLIPFTCGMFLLIASRGHYTRRIPIFDQCRDLVVSAAAFGVIAMIAGFAQRHHQFDGFIVSWWLLLAVILCAGRAGVKLVLSKVGFWRLPVVVVGNEESCASAIKSLELDPTNYDCVATVSIAALPENIPVGFWKMTAARFGARQIMLAVEPSNVAANALVRSIICDGLPFTMVGPSASLPVFGVNHTTVFGHDVVMSHFIGDAARFGRPGVKTALDVVVATLLVVVLAPVMLLIAAFIRADGGPALFAHERVGMGGRRFACLKFRSMVVDPDRVLDEVLSNDPAAAAEWAETQKLETDPRVTSIGRILRATSLDELPQLFNVLRREMSLVGPRPVTDKELGRYGDDVSYYLRARPGLTGLWQVSGRSNISYTRRVEMDAWYVRNWNLWNDIVILALTVPAVFKRSGAR